MGQITRLIENNLVGGNGTNDVYPITSTNAVIQPGTNKTLEEILDELGRQDSVRSIKNVELVNTGRTIRFVYTDDDIKDIDLPEGVKSISIQKQGDVNIMTITGTDGNTTIYNVEGNNMTYEVSAKDNTVVVDKTVDDENNVTTFEVHANIPTVNNGTLTIKQGNNVLGTFTANQNGDTLVEVPTIAGETGQQGADGKSAYQVAVDNGFVGTEAEWLLSLKGQDGQDGQDGSDATVTVVNNAPYVNGTTVNEEVTIGTINNTPLSIKVKKFIRPTQDVNIQWITVMSQSDYNNITPTNDTIYFIPAQQ